MYTGLRDDRKTETAADSTAAAPPRPTDGTGYRYIVCVSRLPPVSFYRYIVQVQKHRGSRDIHGVHTNLTTNVH